MSAATVSARATPASTPIERCITCAAGSTPSAYQTPPSTRSPWRHVPSRRPLRALQQFGRIAAEDRGRDRRIAAEPEVDAAAPLAGGGELGELGGAARSAEADTRARLLPCAAEHVGARCGALLVRRWVQSSPTEFLPIDTCAAGLTAPALRTPHIGVGRRCCAPEQQHRKQRRVRKGGVHAWSVVLIGDDRQQQVAFLVRVGRYAEVDVVQRVCTGTPSPPSSSSSPS